jgi:hypothetical protein
MFSGKRPAQPGMAQAEAVVLDSRLLGNGMGGRFRYRLRLRVHCPGQPPFEADLKGLFDHMVAAGDVLPVRCDTGQGRIEIDVQALKAAGAARVLEGHQQAVAAAETALAADGGEGDAGLARDLQGTRQPGGPDPGVVSESGADVRLQRLRQLADLRDRGTLTEAEFAAEKARILGGGS